MKFTDKLIEYWDVFKNYVLPQYETHIFKLDKLGIPDEPGFIKLISTNYGFNRNILYYYPKLPGNGFFYNNYIMYNVEKLMLVKDNMSFTSDTTKINILKWISINRNDLLFYYTHACYSDSKCIIDGVLERLIPLKGVK